MRTYLVLGVFLVGCGSKANSASDAGVDGGDSYYLPTGFTLTPFLSTDPVRSFPAAGNALQPGRDYAAVIESDAGRIVLDLTETDTPITVNSFVWLALHHFYDDLAFHRVVVNWVVQAGDPSTTDPDSSHWTDGDPGYSFGVEIVPSLNFDAMGMLGMARRDSPDTNGSQFFITLGADSSLDGLYTSFGHVTEGLTVLPQIAVGEPPAVPTRMQRVYIVERAQ